MDNSYSDIMQFAKFVINHLLKPYPDSNFAKRAIVETERPLQGNTWFWADDNAKILELLSNPQIWRVYPAEVNDIIHFLLAMIDGPLIFRRVGIPRLQSPAVGKDDKIFKHSLMNVCADPGKGVVKLGMRFHDGRTSWNVILTGNYIRFVFRGRSHTVDVEDNICDSGSEICDHTMFFWWKSKIQIVSKNPFKKQVYFIGILTYTCSVKASSLFFDLKVEFEIEHGVKVSDVVLSSTLDDLSHGENNIRYERMAIVSPTHQAQFVSATAGSRLDIQALGCAYWAVFQRSYMPGFAAAIHNLPVGECPASMLRVICRENEAEFHSVVSEFQFAGPQSGKLVAQDRKIITSGGFYAAADTYAQFLQRQSLLSDTSICPIDFSVSYDYGVEVHSLARCFRTLSGDNINFANEELKAKLQESISHLFDVYNDYFLEQTPDGDSGAFSRSLSFVALAYAEMLEATGEARYAEELRKTCELICSCEIENAAVDGSPQSGFVMNRKHDPVPFADCHAACLLALTRSTELLGENDWLPSIDRGLSAFCIDTVLINLGGPRKQDVVGVDFLDSNGERRTLEAFWNYKAGLCLRLFNALRNTKHEGLRAIGKKHSERLSIFEMLMRERINRSLRKRETGTEILTSTLSNETNSETQPWVALGLCGER